MEVAELALKAVAGGAFVVLFATASEAVSPKLLAGVFATAPAVAVAGLLLTIVFKTPHAARESSVGMIGGAVAITTYSAFVTQALRRGRALRSSILALPVWFVTAFALYFVAIR